MTEIITEKFKKYGVDNLTRITHGDFVWEDIPTCPGLFFGHLKGLDHLCGRVSPNHAHGFGYSATVFDGTQEDFERRGKIGKFETFDEAREACEAEMLKALKEPGKAEL